MNWNLLKRCVRFNVETMNERLELCRYREERIVIISQWTMFHPIYVILSIVRRTCVQHVFPSMAANIAWIIKLAEAWFFKSIALSVEIIDETRRTEIQCAGYRERERGREKEREKDRTNATTFLQRLFFVTYGEFNVSTQRSVST